MRGVAKFLILCVAVIAIAWFVSGLPGTIVASLAGFTVSAATPIAILVLVVLFAVLLAVLWVLSALLGLPAALRRWRARRRRRLGDREVTRTLVALAANEPDGSRTHSKLARRLLGDTPQTLLLAAEASRVAGDDATAGRIFEALAEQKDAAFLGLRGLFRQAVAREDWPAATALARRAEASHPGSNWLREERTTLAVRTGDWTRAQALAGPGAPRLAYATAAVDAEPDAARAMKLAKRNWTENRGFAPAAIAYASRLRADNRDNRAQEVLREAWQVSPHPDLAAFALAPVTDRLARLGVAERLAATAPGHPESEILLTRTALEDGLTGEARRHAERGRAAGLNDKRLWLLIAELESREPGEAGQAAQRDALRRAAAADPDPMWRCEVCTSVHPHWLAVCPTCHTAGRISWSRPGTRTALLA